MFHWNMESSFLYYWKISLKIDRKYSSSGGSIFSTNLIDILFAFLLEVAKLSITVIIKNIFPATLFYPGQEVFITLIQNYWEVMFKNDHSLILKVEFFSSDRSWWDKDDLLLCRNCPPLQLGQETHQKEPSHSNIWAVNKCSTKY